MIPSNSTKLDYGEAKGGPSHRVGGIAIVAVFSSLIVIALGSILIYYYTTWLHRPLGWIGLGPRAGKITSFHDLECENNGMARPFPPKSSVGGADA